MKFSDRRSLAQQTVSHNAAIPKYVFIEKNCVPNVIYFSQAEFPPGEIAGAHRHIDMTELFYVVSGDGEIEVDGKVQPLGVGNCVVVDPGELHEVRNTGSQMLILLCQGLKAEQ